MNFEDIQIDGEILHACTHEILSVLNKYLEMHSDRPLVKDKYKLATVCYINILATLCASTNRIKDLTADQMFEYLVEAATETLHSTKIEIDEVNKIIKATVRNPNE